MNYLAAISLALLVSVNANCYSQQPIAISLYRDSSGSTETESEPVTLAVNNNVDVSKLKTWLTTHGLEDGGTVHTTQGIAAKRLDVSVLRFHIPHDNLSIQVQYFSRTNRVSDIALWQGPLSEIPVPFGDLRSSGTLRVSRLTLNPDSSCQLTLVLPAIKNRPYVIKNAIGEKPVREAGSVPQSVDVLAPMLHGGVPIPRGGQFEPSSVK